MTGGHEGELAPEISQRGGRQIPDDRLAVVANAFFVDEQQMARCTKSKFDLVVCDALDDLDGDIMPRGRAAIDGGSRDDLECVATRFVDLTIRQLLAAAIARQNVVRDATVDPQQPCSFRAAAVRLSRGVRARRRRRAAQC
jgi:hypothetical protein